MKALELFSGSQSFRKVAEPMGLEVQSLDIKQVGDLKTEFIMDYMDFDVTKLGFIPDFVWASPDCAAFSQAANDRHFAAGSIEPKTDKARKSIEVVKKLHSDILYLVKVNPSIVFWIENPVGKMAWLPFMKEGLFQAIPGLKVVQLDQCAYGRKFKKPTHIFTNDKIFVGKKCTGIKCKHHESKGINFTGGKGNGYHERAMLPPELIKELLMPYLGCKI